MSRALRRDTATLPLFDEEPSLLHGFFESAAARWPDEPAVEIPPGTGRPGRRVVTYATLSRQADALAASLAPSVSGECVVAILLPRTTELLYAAQLGALKAGAAWTCIDPAFPDGHVRDILEDSGAVALVTDAAGRARAEGAGFKVSRVLDAAEAASPRRTKSAVARPPGWLTPKNLAYVIYTSGTTGRPKGVLIEHRSIANLVGSDAIEFGLGPGDRVAQGSSASYDSSVEELWLALASGATVVMMDDEAARLGPDLVAWLRRERITVFCPPPTLLRTTGSVNPQAELPDLRFVYLGGEALPSDVADRWSDGWRLENGYGPTETTVTAIRTTIRKGDEISIGRPIRGVKMWVLNEALEEVPDGERGELCLGGLCVARGYRNRPELTAERFPVHPKFGRIYRSGDLGHRSKDGLFFCHGRIDQQVKLRGYRIELEAIEARLAECDGVLEAACRVQGEGARQLLVGFVVPADPAAPPSLEFLRSALTDVLPSYMVPARLALLPQLPKSVGGKLNRKELPLLEDGDRNGKRPVTSPRSELESKVAAVFREVFEREEPVSIHDDFFSDLGGDSLAAAIAVSLLRGDPATASLTARDLYDGRTVAEVARRAVTDAGPAAPTDAEAETPARETVDPRPATLAQAGFLALGLLAASLLAGAVALTALPALLRALGLVPLVLLGPLLLLFAAHLWAPVAAALAVLAKRLLVGRYERGRAPVWGGLYVRNWMVQQVLKLVPWGLLEGTEFRIAVLRALGARIGERVHLHRGVNLAEGGWDLLTIGDDVTIGQDVSLQLAELEDGELSFGPIAIGDGATLELHTSVEADSTIGREASLAARSALPRGSRVPEGERWDGIPARPAGRSPGPPPLAPDHRDLSPAAAGALLVLSRFALLLARALPAQLLVLAFARAYGIGTASVLAWLAAPTLDPRLVLAAMATAALVVPLTLLVEALLCRAMGPVRPGVLSRWSASWVRVWLKTGLVDAAGRWLWGTLLWPTWLRLAGARIGKGCEISSLIDTVPELVEIGPKTFCADGIYLGGPRVHRGTVTVAPVHVGKNSFFGNGVVISGGAPLADDILLGVCTVADAAAIPTGTAWFGHPSFELPRRQIVEFDRRLTLDPSPVRRANRVIWEWFRFTLPAVPVLVLPAWYALTSAAARSLPRPAFLLAGAPLALLLALLAPALLVIASKWLLLGRVKPGVHPLWSCFASRWDFICMAWNIHAGGAASALEGSLLLNPLLRLAGVRIGKHVVLGGGFAEDLPDPDMLTFEDGATVDCVFQAHTFEDRVLKLDRIVIRKDASVGRNAVLLYGAEVGAGARVAPNSVVMKHEHLLPGRSYAGFPTRPL